MDAFARVSPNALEARFGSFIAGAQLFDAAAFSISKSESLYMDPQQRLLLQHAAEALALRVAENGVDRQRTGVMVGIGTVEYVEKTSSQLPMGIYLSTGSAISVAAGR